MDKNKIPKIYAYRDENYKGMLKIGYTEGEVVKRVKEQYPTSRPGKVPYTIVLETTAIDIDGKSFKDTVVHRYLRKMKYKNMKDENGRNTEWFECEVKDVKAAILAIKNKTDNVEERHLDFKMRPEQLDAVNKTKTHFEHMKQIYPELSPKFLWNAKMRFGKTFASYQLAKEMKWDRVLVLTFKPAVKDSWETDLKEHIDFDGWQFISSGGLTYEAADKKRPMIVFASLQDYLGTSDTGDTKQKNEWANEIDWNCIIIDEYHFGAWRSTTRELIGSDTSELGEIVEVEVDASKITLKSGHYLYLSGTPFRAIESGEFIEDEIFNWTYSDEQNAKNEWEEEDNPYAALPKLNMYTYKMPEYISRIVESTGINKFDLNTFLTPVGTFEDARFKNEKQVMGWLDLIRGKTNNIQEDIDNLKRGDENKVMPFGGNMRNKMKHTVWFLPDVATCYAMKYLLERDDFYSGYTTVLCAGTKAGIGVRAIEPVREAIANNKKTITLTCGKLTTGVTIPEWVGILMLRNISTPETYFQAAFRVQSPWRIDGKIEKEDCFIFDFDPNRALTHVRNYAVRLNPAIENPEKQIEEFIKFIPILAYEGGKMINIDALAVIDFIMSGTTMSLLTNKWQSNTLVNLNYDILKKLQDDKELLNTIMNIESFRSLNRNIIEKIITYDKVIEKGKHKEKKDTTKKEKKEIDTAKKQKAGLIKQLQEKLVKLITRIPPLMYLTDHRESTLTEVILEKDVDLFIKVTGLSTYDFMKLSELGLFDKHKMNEAVFGFKRYEDSSLAYLGVNKHDTDTFVGGFDFKYTKAEFEEKFGVPVTEVLESKVVTYKLLEDIELKDKISHTIYEGVKLLSSNHYKTTHTRDIFIIFVNMVNHIGRTDKEKYYKLFKELKAKYNVMSYKENDKYRIKLEDYNYMEVYISEQIFEKQYKEIMKDTLELLNLHEDIIFYLE